MKNKFKDFPEGLGGDRGVFPVKSCMLAYGVNPYSCGIFVYRLVGNV